MKMRARESLDGVKSAAVYSDCERYRFALSRIWRDEGKLLTFIMLNPSTATEEKNDPTVERCQRRALAGGYRGVQILNLFAFRATEPKDMKDADEPTGGFDADKFLFDALEECQDGRSEYFAFTDAEAALRLSDDIIAAVKRLSKESLNQRPVTAVETWIKTNTGENA